MTHFLAYSNKGALSLGTEYNRARFKQDLRENDGARYRIERMTPESRDQRGFFEGAVIPLWVYLDGNDWRNSNIVKHYHNESKKEFNGDFIIRAGQKEKIGKSTKGILNKGFLDKVIDFLEEQYGIERIEVLNPETYKRWRDELYGTGETDDFIEYMVETGMLKRTPEYEMIINNEKDSSTPKDSA